MFHHQGHAHTPAPPADRTAVTEKAIETVRTYQGETDGPLNLAAGERRYFTLSDAQLIEPRRGPSHRVGAYAGPSFKVAKGIYLHAGGYAGKTIPGAVTPTVIDTGTAVVTDQRVVFLGAKITREFAWAKMLSYDHDAKTRSTTFHVSNRQAADAIHWGEASAFAFFCDLVHARRAGTVDQLIAALEAEEAPAR